MDNRRGFTLIEALVSCLLLAVLTTLCLELVGDSMAQRRRPPCGKSPCRRPPARWNEWLRRVGRILTPAAVGKIALSREGAAALPGGEVAIQLQPSAEAPLANRITVEVRWCPARGKPAQRVRLVAFRYSVPKPAEDR